jgi:hypothetical protein
MDRAAKALGLAVLAAALLVGPAWAGAPFVPANLAPADGEFGVDMLPTLQWAGGDPDGDAVTYTVFIEGAGQTWTKKTTAAEWTVPLSRALPPDTLYTWSVRARDAGGLVARGEPTTFTTGSYPWISEVLPSLARPTYVVDLYGVHFGARRGSVKLGTRFIDGDLWGKIISWSDEWVRLVLPGYQCWSGNNSLPGEFKLKVFSADGQVSNLGWISVTYGGGGTTW